MCTDFESDFKEKAIIGPCVEDPMSIIAGSFLSVIFLVAFILNLMVMVTVSTSYTLKRFLYCHLLINLCLASMVDCLFNLSIAIGYVFTTQWRFGYEINYLNSFTMNMMNSVMGFAVLMLAIDRLASSKKYNSCFYASQSDLAIMILTTWVLSFLMAVPLVIGRIKSMPYRNRYSCSVADPRDDSYLIFHLVLVVCVPPVVMVVLVCISSVIFFRERRKEMTNKGNQMAGFFERRTNSSYYQNEFHIAVFVTCTVVGYLAFWLPFTALTTINPMLTQDWASETTGGSGRSTNPVANATNVANSTSSNATSNASKSTNGVGIIPEIIGSPIFDTVAVWFRFSFHVLMPVLVLIILREVRAKCKDLVTCRRQESVDVASLMPTQGSRKKSTAFYLA
ncbi:rhodopsin-like [Procambarus clarkii]|uniref:rhodopsin-like n=1 Tax=Procambarus clarkii TaxID=6728 RepID=UPI001E6787A3|nr:neuromedin-K receptor-like [Procambarus clarkii]